MKFSIKKASLTKYYGFVFAIIRLVTGFIGFPLSYLLFVLLINMDIVSNVTLKHQVPFWYPILYLALWDVLLLSNFSIGVYMIAAKKYRSGDVSWKFTVLQIIVLFILFFVLPLLVGDPYQFFVGG